MILNGWEATIQSFIEQVTKALSENRGIPLRSLNQVGHQLCIETSVSVRKQVSKNDGGVIGVWRHQDIWTEAVLLGQLGHHGDALIDSLRRCHLDHCLKGVQHRIRLPARGGSNCLDEVIYPLAIDCLLSGGGKISDALAPRLDCLS